MIADACFIDLIQSHKALLNVFSSVMITIDLIKLP